MPFKLLYITSYYKPAFVYGGPSQSTSIACEKLVELGVDVTVFTTNANGKQSLNVETNQEVIVNGVQVWYFPLRLNGLGCFYAPDLLLKLKGEIKNFDLVVADVLYGYPSFFLSHICKENNKKYVIHTLGQLMPWALNFHRLKKSVYFNLVGNSFIRNATTIRCTDLSEQTAIKELGFTVPTFVIPHGLDLTRFSKVSTKGVFRNKLGITKNQTIIIFLGRLHKVKNPDIALKAFLKLDNKNTHIVFVGPDEQNYQPSLEKLAHSAGMDKQIHFTGLVDKQFLGEVLADTDLLIAPSSQESFGMAIIEALASGVPVIVSKNIPIGQIIEKEKAGKWVNGDVDSFYAAMKLFLENKEQLKEAGLRGKKLVYKYFDVNLVTQCLLERYKEIVFGKNDAIS